MTRIPIWNSCKVKPDWPESHGKSRKSFIQLGAEHRVDKEADIVVAYQKIKETQTYLNLFVCVRSGYILHGAAVFDRERLYGRVTRRLTRLQTMCNVLKTSKTL